MNNSKFRAIPKHNDFKIPFKLEENELLNWLNELSRHNSQEACLQVLRLLQALNKEGLGAKKRISLLATIAEYLKSYIAHLEGVCWDASFPLTMEERVYAEAVTWNYLMIGEGFFISARDLGKKDASVAMAMALQAIGKAQLHMAAVYSIPNDGFWKVIYGMYATAEDRKLLTVKIRELKNVPLGTIFKKLFVFHACDTNQFRARDMRTIYHFLDDVCDNMTIDKKADTEQAYFVFDLKSDTPPIHHKNEHSDFPGSARYFSPVIVAHEIYDILKEGKVWSGTLKSINNALFLRVVKTLSLGQKRKYTRLADGHEVSGVIGFENIVNFLRKQNIPTKPEKDEHGTEIPTDINPKELKLYMDTHNKHQMASVSGEDYGEIDYEVSDSSIWQQQKESGNMPIKDVEIKQIHIFDSSAKGYSVYWSDANSKAKIGDVFGIISEDKKRLEIALIRRIAMSTEEDFRFGAEVIGFESEIVYICRARSTDECSWAIFIPGIKALKQPDTLVFSIGSFHTGDGIYIYKDGQKIKGLLIKELHSTSGILLVELAYPESRKQGSENREQETNGG